jgi:hypothetical protein
MKTFFLNFRKRDIFWFITGATLFVGGLSLAILGFISDLLTVPSQQNWIKQADLDVQAFLGLPISWLTWGTILFVLGAIIITLVLNSVATIEQVDREKKLRRAQRLQEAAE